MLPFQDGSTRCAVAAAAPAVVKSTSHPAPHPAHMQQLASLSEDDEKLTFDAEGQKHVER